MTAHSISFKISPKEVSYAVFREQRLVFWETHSYLSTPKQNVKNAIGDVARCIDRFKTTAAALEPLQSDDETFQLQGAVKEALRNLAVPIFEISEQELFDSFGLPALKTRQELRETVISIFPQLESSRFMNSCLDAAALGLHFETSRILSA
jgi:hypothetical protein